MDTYISTDQIDDYERLTPEDFGEILVKSS